MNTRLQKLLREHKDELTDRCFLDDYNQAVFKEFTPTITTRIVQSCHYFIYEEVRSQQEQG